MLRLIVKYSMKYQLRTIPNTHISVSYINRQISSVIYNIFELSKKWNKVATSWLENSYKKLGLQRSFFRWYLWYCVPFDSYKNIERFSFEKVFKVNKSADKIRYFHEIMSKQNLCWSLSNFSDYLCLVWPSSVVCRYLFLIPLSS